MLTQWSFDENKNNCNFFEPWRRRLLHRLWFALYELALALTAAWGLFRKGTLFVQPYNFPSAQLVRKRKGTLKLLKGRWGKLILLRVKMGKDGVYR